MALLQLVTMRMKVSNCWDLAFFGHLIFKNGKRASMAVERDSLKIEETADLVEKQEMWIARTY